MVDVGDKQMTRRAATAQAVVTMQPDTLEKIVGNNMPKGDVFACARIAGIMAAKRTSELIPMCHPLPIDSVEVELVPLPPDRVKITSTLRCTYRDVYKRQVQMRTRHQGRASRHRPPRALCRGLGHAARR